MDGPLRAPMLARATSRISLNACTLGARRLLTIHARRIPVYIDEKNAIQHFETTATAKLEGANAFQVTIASEFVTNPPDGTP